MVSFIILNYNTAKLVEDCINSLKRCVRCAHEIIVVDNCSNQEDLDYLRNLSVRESFALIQNKINGGFGAGNMAGALAAKGKYYCFINSDVTFVEDAITPLIAFLGENKDCGCITPQQYTPDGRFVPSFKHGTGIRHEVLGDNIFEFLFPQRFPLRKTKKQLPFNAPEINGCFMLFPAKVFWEIGGFDTNIYLYYEEYDICRRLHQAGYKSVVYPSVSFKHLRGGSSNKKTPKSIKRELFVSRIYVYAKHHNALYTSLFRTILLIKSIFIPKKWHFLPILLSGESLAHSMKHQNMKPTL